MDDYAVSYFKWLCTTLIIFSYPILKYLTFLTFLSVCFVLSFPWLYHNGISKSSSSCGVYPSPFLQQKFLITGISLDFCVVEFLSTSIISAFKASIFFPYFIPTLLFSDKLYDFLSSAVFISTFLFSVPRPLMEMLNKIIPRLILEEYNWASYSRIQLLYWAISSQLCNKIIFEKGTECIYTQQICPGEAYENL